VTWVSERPGRGVSGRPRRGVSGRPRRGVSDRVTGRPVSPRAFRPLGIEAVVLGPPTAQDGLTRREGVAVWRRLPGHAAVFDRVAGTSQAGVIDGTSDLLAVRVVVLTTASRQRGLRAPAVGGRAARALEAGTAGEPNPLPPQPGWLLLVDEGPGETWLYLAEERDPARAVRSFIGRRGRTDFARARRRTRVAGWASAAILGGFGLGVYAPPLGLGGAGQAAGGLLVAAGLALLVAVRAR
jgi:hypothetical protein